MRDIVLIAHNLRSAHNVGSLLRTGEGLGVSKIYLSGYTPYPKLKGDARLPHIANKVHNQISKTALGAEGQSNIEHSSDIFQLISDLQGQNYLICSLEQAPKSESLPTFKPPDKIALIIGREVEGIEPEILNVSQKILQIPMFGHKESFNVAAAAAMALYHLRFL